jgi:NAD-dependent deacetylase
MKKLVVLTGSGISSESGLKTFRESGGLWENYDVMEVASLAGWNANMELVLRFYNERRVQLKYAKPNDGHKGLVDLEKYFDVSIITQNVDNLHELAGSSKVLHLHGILTQARSTGDPNLIYNINYDPIHPGDKCEKGYQLRPNIVWFGEAVMAIEEAALISSTADIFVVVGTSMVVYPAAGLVDYVPKSTSVFLIDPNEVAMPVYRHINFIREKAGTGVKLLKKKLLNEYLVADKE